MSDEDPFERKEGVDEPGIVGARWWNNALAARTTRRALLRGVGIAAVLLTVTTGVGYAIVKGVQGDFREELRPSLEMQQTYGWCFGATDRSVIYTGAHTPKNPNTFSQLDNLPQDLAPVNSALAPYYQRALTMVTVLPPKPLPETSTLPKRLDIMAITNSGMDAHFERGKAVGASMGAGDAVIVDLEGPDSVAFAAGAAELCDPVLLFDNWPHPLGVVRAHMTLAALVQYQQRFVEAKAKRKSGAPPIFVLDSTRLSSYADDANHFDNRWFAKLPDARALAELGVTKVHYVVQGKFPQASELDDLNELFVAYHTARIYLRLIESPRVEGVPYTPISRSPEFKTEPFAKVMVMVNRETDLIHGAKHDRSGSWNRASGGFGG